MAQYLDEQGLRTLVTKTKEYANKRVKEGLNTSAAAASKTITGWDDATSAATYSDIVIPESQVTNLTADLASKAPLTSPAFSGTPTVPNVDITAAGSQQIANTKYVKDLVGNIGEAMHYKGAVDRTRSLPTTDYKAGDTYKVAEAGTYAGKTCEVGDMIIAAVNYVSGSASNDDWNVIQTNIDGAVTGPGAATSGHFAIFDGDTGKVIKDAGYGLDHFKTVQTASAFANSDALKTIDTISQNENGDITSVTFQDIQTASTAHPGVVQLTSTSGTAENVAATPKLATDLYNALNTAKQDNLTFDGTYDASTNKVATVSTVSGAIKTLDADVTSNNGTNVQVQVTEADGKITGVNITTDNTVAKVTGAENNFVLFGTDGAIKDAGLTSGAFATSAQGAKADSAIQGVKLYGASSVLTPDSSKIVTIPLATSGDNGNDGLMSKADKGKLDNLSADLDKKADKKVPAVAGNIATLDANGNLTDGGHGLDHYKTVQTAVTDPTATGNAISFIDTISQDTNGVITATKKTVPLASASQDGLMSSSAFNKLTGIAASATKVNMGEGANSGTLYINDVSAMGPISNTLIEGLFT
jgi:hypothetical protein